MRRVLRNIRNLLPISSSPLCPRPIPKITSLNWGKSYCLAPRRIPPSCFPVAIESTYLYWGSGQVSRRRPRWHAPNFFIFKLQSKIAWLTSPAQEGPTWPSFRHTAILEFFFFILCRFFFSPRFSGLFRWSMSSPTIYLNAFRHHSRLGALQVGALIIVAMSS